MKAFFTSPKELMASSLIILIVVVSAFFGLIHWEGYYGYQIHLAYSSVFAWVIYKPHHNKVPWLLLLGALQDATFDTPMGLTSGAYWFIWWFTLNQRRFLIKRHFIITWLTFTGVAVILEAVRFTVLGFFYQSFPRVHLFVYDFWILLMLFPLIAKLIYHLAHDR